MTQVISAEMPQFSRVERDRFRRHRGWYLLNYGSPPLRIALIYIAVAGLWILLSDSVVSRLFNNVRAMEIAQQWKGLLFVLVTGVLLYLLISRDVNALGRAHADLLDSYEQTMRAWVQVIDLRHKETSDHTRRVSRMTVALARRAGVPERQLKSVEHGAILHDIGKVGIPDEILIKPGKLSDDEWVVMKKHPEIARDLLMSINYLCSSVDIPYCHHEKWDGTGYPRALKGAEIPLAARVFAVVDVWDALSFDRVYKKAWPEERVLAHLQEQAGKHFDPHVVRLFLDNYAELKAEINRA